MGTENEEFCVTSEFRHGLQSLYRDALRIYLKPMIPWEAFKNAPDGEVARAGRIAQACEVIYYKVGLQEEQYRILQEAMLANSLAVDY